MIRYIKLGSGFTLIELMVVITIIGILFAGSYVPYDYYSRISRVRISVEKIYQAREDAKILAQNGQIFPGTENNANIGLLFTKGSHNIEMFAFMPGKHSFTENSDAKIIKKISLEDGVNINSLPYDKMLLEYSAPKGNIEIYKSPTETGSAFDVGIGWRTSIVLGPLFKKVAVEK